ncbi:MAG: peptidase U32 family protein [bacterium]
MTNKKKRPELLAPAGDFTMLSAAINSGADAVYIGLNKLNMRAKAKNFSIEELPKVVEYCKSKNVDLHVTLNSIVFEEELGELDFLVSEIKRSGADIVICWDMSVIQKCLEHQMPFCISTQASISNSASALFYENLGAKRIVLARECALDKIKEIRPKVNLEIETFIHGAMCVAISGRCFMSHEVFGKSANRGDCLQPCRREYEIKDMDEKFNLTLGEDYVMSPKDLCTVEYIDKLIEANIDSFKIEGRKRSPEYIAKVVSVYREAIDIYSEGNLTEEKKKEYLVELKKVYNRGFSKGFYFGTPGEQDFAGQYGSKATTRKIYIGKILNYYKKSNVAYAKLEAEFLIPGDKIYIIGNTTGVVEKEIEALIMNDKHVDEIAKGNDFTFKCDNLVRENDKIFKIVEVD